MTELITSHILVLGGLVLVTIGLLQETMALNIAGMWAFVLGLCIVFSAGFRRLARRK